ncbi:MAG TPA: ATP-binding protein [Actinomycetota bacterium]|nr:ATP-binding protein [Actinomycetota bacterium]
MESERLLIPYRLRTVRFGLLATVLAVGALLAYPLVPGPQRFHVALYSVVVAGASAGALIVWRLPWVRAFESGYGMWFFYVWSVLDILLISVAIVATGGGSSQLFLIYALTTIFFALAYPLRAQVVLLLFTFACWFGAVLVHGTPFDVQDLYIRMAMVGVLSFLSGRLSIELTELTNRHHAAHDESERRATLLAAVAAAGRSMSSLDSERVLDVVVSSTIALGYDAADLSLFDHRAGTVSIALSRGLPPSVTGAGPFPAEAGLAGAVLDTRRTVIDADLPANPQTGEAMLHAGFRSAVSAPVWVNHELAGVLTGTSRAQRQLPELDVEAFELLAAQAGRALENARRFEEERAAVTRLANLDRLKRDFIATVSHELRTPLTVMSGLGRTMQEHWDRLTDEQRELFVDRIVANATSLEGIITTLLDFSRLEEGRLEANPTALDLGSSVSRVTERLGPLFAKHTLSVDVPSEVVVVADPVLFERVMENLLANAVKHTPPGTAVALSARCNGSRALISVADDGPGIPRADLTHLGERFFRGGEHTTRTTRGTGLGLAIVREVLRLHDSALEISSAEGEGSSFSFRLPLSQRPAA